jgi:Do/DeqQ family serine protease
MKQTKKIIFGLSLVALVASGATAMTADKTLLPDKNKTTFSEAFKQNPNSVISGAVAQPVDLTKASELAVHAVVHIRSTQASKVVTVDDDPFGGFFDDFFGGRSSNGGKRQVRTQPQVGIGSGVIISQDGYIVTNNHVVEGADEIEVTLNDNRNFKARVIGTDKSTDLALIKISGDNLPTLPVGDSDALKVGEWVIAVGNPFNLSSTVTAGIVSAKARTLGTYGVSGVESFIQTDAAINQGNSGGALVNVRGELVGINAVLSSPTGANVGYGFAIPSNIMKKVITDLKEYGTVQRAMLGIEGTSFPDALQNAENDETMNKLQTQMKDLGVVDGVLIAKITDGGSAAASDLKVNDVIIGLNDTPVHKMADLQGALAKFRPGQTVKVKVMRNKKEKVVDVLLKNEKGTTTVVKTEKMDVLGAAFREVPDSEKRELGISNGLEVTGLIKGKMMDAGINKGFIILQAGTTTLSEIKTQDDLEAALQAASRSPQQSLFIVGMYPSGRRASYAIDLSTDNVNKANKAGTHNQGTNRGRRTR